MSVDNAYFPEEEKLTPEAAAWNALLDKAHKPSIFAFQKLFEQRINDRLSSYHPPEGFKGINMAAAFSLMLAEQLANYAELYPELDLVNAFKSAVEDLPNLRKKLDELHEPFCEACQARKAGLSPDQDDDGINVIEINTQEDIDKLPEGLRDVIESIVGGKLGRRH